MKKLTSKATFFHKRIFPLIWFGPLGLFLYVGLFTDAARNGRRFGLIVFSLGMAVFGYYFMKKLVWDLVDEVCDEGTSLLFRNGGKEVRVSLKDIKNVSYCAMTSPPRVTVSFRHKTELGDELSFSPPASWLPFKKNEEIERLIDRIDDARATQVDDTHAVGER